MQAFDLNIEKVLEHWSAPFAIRELIANALDEQALTGTADPVIVKDSAGCWHIADRSSSHLSPDRQCPGPRCRARAAGHALPGTRCRSGSSADVTVRFG